MTTRPLSQKRIQKSAAAIFFGWTVLVALLYYYTLNFSVYISIIDSLITNGLLGFACIALSNLLGFYQPKKDVTLYTVVVAFMLSLIIIFSGNLLLEQVIRDVTYLDFLKLTIALRFIIVFIFLAWSGIANLLWYKLEEQSEAQGRLLDTQNLAKEAELNKLRHQLQPHFLFNSLNSVYALTIVNPGEAGTMITKLASFLRGTLKRDDETLILVAEEMEYIQLYLDIEKVRFSHRLNLDVQVDENSLGMRMPGTVLQPIVENAIKFGLYNTSAPITITIRVVADHGTLLISVQNPYDPDMQGTEGTGFGLSAIRRRLYLLFADNNLLQTQTVDRSLFITTLRIPQYD
ncbi:sensor histidine kinase [Pedobacter duraquae]|uniref:Histidine kinase n=1 Tax=Pedobacter duraquae TaxID=425511 RepID=A0A4R6IQ19_9SPHI|nr:histidine kinase [Pedobacter duraquae]TDO24409.1 histidine kinase [Pedobacter duraquae]